MIDPQLQRAALIARLAERSPARCIGRTAVMKFCYLLQTLRRVPLGYHFTLYCYGPFDADVLSDLDAAEALGVVTSSVVPYPGGYGYNIRPTGEVAHVERWAGEFLRRYDTEIGWVLAEFGNLGAVDLELTSTIVYVDFEAARRRETLSRAELARRVQDVKPRFPEPQICGWVELLSQKRLLSSLPAHSGSSAWRVPADLAPMTTDVVLCGLDLTNGQKTCSPAVKVTLRQ
jgi:hypothetical protein